MNCADLEPLLTRYVDGEASAEELSLIESHLHRCPPCERLVAREHTAKVVLRACSPRLSSRAPDALHAKCSAVARTAQSAQVAASAKRPVPLWRRASLSIAATLVFVVGGALALSFSSASPTAVAAQLTLDHLKCFAVSEPHDVATTPEAIANAVEDRCGWRIHVPGASAAEHLELVGVRRCLYSDGRVAHLFYKRDGRPLSLFVMAEAPVSRGDLELLGHEAVIWTEDGKTYALIGRESRDEMRQLAGYMRAGLHE